MIVTKCPPRRAADNREFNTTKKRKAKIKEIQTERRNQRKQVDPFYRSMNWLNLRYRVLKKFGPKCMLCGITSRDGAVICVDHIKPRAEHPELELEFDNMQVLCNCCNVGKGSWDSTDWLSVMIYKEEFLAREKSRAGND